ncbi:MAG: SRPBCC family protein [Aquihabitans sp.]
MPHYRTTVRTPWSQQRAFDYLADLEHFAEWDPEVKRSVQIRGQGPTVGSAFDVTIGGFGPDTTLRYEIIDLESAERIEVRAETRTLVSVDVMTFEPSSDGGCVVTYDADLSLKSVLALGNPILGVIFGRIGDRAATGLRRVLEGTVA